MNIHIACLNRKALETVLYHVHVLKDVKSEKVKKAMHAARCYRVGLVGTVHTIGKKFGRVRVYGVTFPNGGRAWTFGPDYLRKATDVNG